MIDVRKFDSLGHANHGWLDARHHFSFANYHDPGRMGWGRIRVWNDDKIGARSGFPAASPPRHGDRDLRSHRGDHARGFDGQQGPDGCG
jgi:redox-sensitive bicupin YhaK (pirin superfamily)